MNRSFVLLSLCFIITQVCLSQEAKPKRSTVGISGSSKSLKNGGRKYYSAQSVGQASVIGSFSSGNKTINQGYLHPPYRIRLVRNDESNPLGIKIFPNPFSSTVTISIEESVTVPPILKVYDLKGQVAFQKTYEISQKLEVDLSALKYGFYLIEVNVDDEISRSKIVKK